MRKESQRPPKNDRIGEGGGHFGAAHHARTVFLEGWALRAGAGPIVWHPPLLDRSLLRGAAAGGGGRVRIVKRLTISGTSGR